MGRTKARGNGQGTAYRRGKGWQSRVVVGWKMSKDGSHSVPVYRTKDGFPTKREALDYCKTLLSNKETKNAPNLEYYYDEYCRAEMQTLSDSKQTAYKIAWAKLKTIMYHKVDVLTVGDLRKVVAENAPTYYPARDMKVLLGHLFDLAGADGWVNRDLPDYIILPELNEKERQPFTEEEQAALWKAYESGCKNAAIPLIMIYTGMMTGEMRRLTVEMIDFEKRQIVGVGLKTKVRKESAVYLASAIIPVLQDITAGKTGLIYDCTEMAFYDLYYDALAAAGCRKLTPYSCRHTTATALAITEHIAPQTIQKLMRWSSTRMLDRYAHPTSEDAATAINVLQRPSN